MDILSLKLGWDRETVLAYFTKVLAQKRYNMMQNTAEIKRINPDAMEELRKNPEKYLSQMDFDIVNNHKPDISILYDNQIIDVVIEKAQRDIENLCDQQNLKSDVVLTHL